ncbi:MAG: phosphoribosylglycinamide formyltransferase [Gallionellaceae bacterium]|nr:phosphoribosylglycinamide formyltransferase [Gallionellaceae bacterium]
MKKVVILISGRGSNMQSLLEAKLPCEFVAVISNKADAGGLKIAQQHGIPTAVVSHRDHADRAAFDMALAEVIDSYQADLVVLAGFMRILTTPFVERYRGKLINIHPSLLPSFAGINTHERALQEGVKIHGCTVHFVTPTLDSGPIIIQAAVPVLRDDTPAKLSARVLREEHRIFPQAVRWLCREQVWLNSDGRVATNRLEQPGAALISPGLS